MKNALHIVVGAACLAAGIAAVRADWPYDQVDKVDRDPLETIVSGWKGAAPKAPRKILYFSDCFGYNHHGGRCYGDWTFRRAGEVSGAWTLVQTHDVKIFADAARLKEFDAIVFCNSTGVAVSMAPGMDKALVDFVKGGKGIALIHAGLDAFKDSDALLAFFGGYFRGHPWHADGTWKIRNEAPADPINAPFRANGASFFKVDEIYQFPAFFDRATCKVLLSVDLSDPLTKAAEDWWKGYFGEGSTRADHDYAVSWTKTQGKGRIFYTSFGHDRCAFLDAQRLYHMFAGVQYALGDLTPDVAAAHGPAIPEKRTDWAGGPWGEKLDGFVKEAQGKDLDFVFLGDSITMLWMFPAADRLSGGKEVWERHFGKMKTMNLGMSGDRTEHLLWRVARGGQADGWKAKTIFLMIGINNHGQKRPGWDRSDTPAEAASGTKAILDVLKAKHPEAKIVLFGALPWKTSPGFKWERAYNGILATYAGGNVVFEDIGPLFLASPTELKPGLLRDGLHPGPEGYEVEAKAMEKYLAR